MYLLLTYPIRFYEKFSSSFKNTQNCSNYSHIFKSHKCIHSKICNRVISKKYPARIFHSFPFCTDPERM